MVDKEKGNLGLEAQGQIKERKSKPQQKTSLAKQRENALADFNITRVQSRDQLKEKGLVLLPFVLEIKQKGKKPRTYLLVSEDKGGDLEHSKISALKAAKKNQGYLIESGIKVRYWSTSKETELGNDASKEAFDVSLRNPYLWSRVYIDDRNDPRAVGNLTDKAGESVGEVIIKGNLSDYSPSYDGAIESIGRTLVPAPKA